MGGSAIQALSRQVIDFSGGAPTSATRFVVLRRIDLSGYDTCTVTVQVHQSNLRAPNFMKIELYSENLGDAQVRRGLASTRPLFPATEILADSPQVVSYSGSVSGHRFATLVASASRSIAPQPRATLSVELGLRSSGG